MQHRKEKSASKVITSDPTEVRRVVENTLAQIAQIVGSTLGPGGQPVLLEREEFALLPYATKDGVTVYRSLGYTDPVAQVVLEAARDASVRTASEAGDGTTTTAVLSHALVKAMSEYCANHPGVSPQAVARKMLAECRDNIVPVVDALSYQVDSSTDFGQKMMHAIAMTSANGDEELADAVIETFRECGDEGNVTLVEATGPSGFQIEKIEGYPIAVGYEDSCGRYASRFLNDKANQRIVLDNPVFILYHGKVVDWTSLVPLLEQIHTASTNARFNHNVVVVATGFSESVVGNMLVNFERPDMPNIVPLVIPSTPQLNSHAEFLDDMAAITGATVLSQTGRTLENATLEDLGVITSDAADDGTPRMKCASAAHIEITRFRSLVLGMPETQAAARIERLDALKARLLTQKGSELDGVFLQERIAKLAGGIARLKIFGGSGAELKERRDRAEDAVCAVRGGLRYGALPGAGWTLAYLAESFEREYGDKSDSPIMQVLVPALREPFRRLLQNAGYNQASISALQENLKTVVSLALDSEDVTAEARHVYNIMTGEWGDALAMGLVDSTPAVRDAIRNAVSIAGTLGTLGGIVSFPRDEVYEREEAQAKRSFERHSGQNPANERA